MRSQKRTFCATSCWVLFVLAVVIASTEAYIPILYPSLVENHGFVYREESDRVLSLPGAIEHLLCSSGSGGMQFDAADQDCSTIVVFTSSNTITLQLMNLSSNGVIQPFQLRPQVKTALDDGRISLKAYGAAGELELDVIGQAIPEAPEEESYASAEAPDLEPDGLEEADGSLDAIGSNEAPGLEEPEDVEEYYEDFEAQERLSTAQLMSDMPLSVESSGVDGVDDAVLQANATANFLHSNGTVRSDQAFVVEARLERLPRDELLEVTIRFERGVRRRIYVYRATSSASAKIRLLAEESRRNGRNQGSYRYEVEFSDFVFNTPSADQVECPDVRDRLKKFSGEELDRDDKLEANDLTSMVDAARNFRSCSAQLDAFVPSELVSVSGVQATTTGTQGNLSLRKLREGRTGKTRVLVDFQVSLNRRTRLGINVRSEAGVDLAGRPLQGTTENFRIERENKATQRSVETAEGLGRSTTVVAGSAVATSVTATVGASMAASVTGTAVTGSAGTMTTGGSITGAIELLSAGQRIYLISRMAVPNMPENFQKFGDSLSWTMLDIKLPWRDNSVEVATLAASNTTEGSTDEEDSDVVVFEREWRYEGLVMTLTWMALLFVGLLALHMICIAIFFTCHWDLPNVLRIPRLELYFLHWVTPAFAGACATLFTGNDNQLWLGVLLMFLFPIPFVLWHAHLLMKNFLLKDPEKFRVFYEVPKSSKMISKKFGYAPAGGDSDRDSTSMQKPPSLLETYLWTPLLGPPYTTGAWKTVEGPSNKFVDRFGPVFEDYRHIPGLRRNATFEVRDESKIHRGHFKPLKSSWNPTRIANVVQISGALLTLCRMVFISCLILGQDDPKSNAQAVTLLILSIVHLLVLRFFRPHPERWHLGLVMIEEVVNILTYAIVFYLLNNDASERQEVRRNIGFAMLCFEGAGFFLIFLEQSVRSILVLKDSAKSILEKLKGEPQILKVIINAQLQNPRYLERVYPGVLTRDRNAPFEEMFWADPAAAMRSLVRFRRNTATEDENKSIKPPPAPK